MRPAVFTVTGVGVSNPYGVDTYISPSNMGLAVTVSGTITYKVQYTFEGNIHEYNPDLKVCYDDGRIEIWEIKPSNQTNLPRNNAKWTACNQYCQQRGLGFMVLTEVGMAKLKQRIKSLNT